MPFCPNCRAEYSMENTRCAECDVGLVDSLPQNDRDGTDRDEVELVELAGFPNASEAEMIQELLEGNGIIALIRGNVDPIGAVSGAEPTTLLVNRSDFDRAREIYDAFFAGDAAPTEPQQS